MLKIYKSNSLIALAVKQANYLADNSPKDPFDSIQIVVPNQDTSRWLKLQLADTNEIVANVEFLLPAEWQFRQIRKLYPNLPTLLPSDPGPLTWTIFDYLMNTDQRQKFSRVNRYITSQPIEMREQAAMQLAEKISSAFDQYLVYRPELIMKWQSGDIADDTDELWQAKLWNLIEAERKIREKGKGYPNRAELELEATDAIKKGNMSVEKPLFLFNTGLIPKQILQMAENLSKQSDVVIFKISPSIETGVSSANSNSLLEAFGDEARGTAELYDELEGKVDSNYLEPDKPDTLLQKIQQSILSNRSVGSWNVEEDGSHAIEVHSCHTPLREIEVLHQFLLRAFEADQHLHPDDVLVVMPDPDIYKPFIHAVFGTKSGDLPDIPYHAGFNSISNSGLIRQFIQLLDIADSRMEFADVMDLFMEKNIREHFNVSESGADRIKRWMKENNVIWGIDSEHRVDSGQPGENLHTWQLAIKRGWNGIFSGSQDDPFKEEELHFLRIRGSDQEMEWSSFSSFLRLLSEFSTSINKKRSAETWCDKLEELIITFFSKESLEGKESDTLWRALQKTKESVTIAGARSKVSYKLIRRIIRNILTAKPASTAFFTRGVTFSSMVPARSIPAKIIALIGLNESEFPRKPKHTDFDLMARNPKPTERNRKNEDRNLFLESILAAKDFHYCSYIGRSRRDNEPIPPSPIVSEWLNHIGEAVGKPPNDLIIQEPLHGFSAENFKKNKSYAQTEFLVAKLLNQNGSEHPGLFLSNPISDQKESNEIKIDDFLNFYSNPLKGFFKSRFQPEINAPDEQPNEFVLNNLERHKLFEQVFKWKLAQISDEDIMNILFKTGLVPAGWHGESILSEIIHYVDAAILFLQDRNMEPQLHGFNTDIYLKGMRLSGIIKSYSNSSFLDISASSFSGSKVLKSWLCHLTLTSGGNVESHHSHFLCDLKKGDPTLISFQPVENASKVISQLLTLYQKGISSPEMLFPDTSYEYEKAVLDGKGNEEYKAVQKFEGSQHNPYAENMDFFLSLLRGEEPSFRMDYINQEFQAVIRIMLNHMDPIK